MRGLRGRERVSIVVATRNRPEKLARTLVGLERQSREEYEVVVVDDGSDPPLSVAPSAPGYALRTVRTPGIGRSAGRNLGAETAAGELLVFVDDDISVGPEFLDCHITAHEEWPGALATGAIRLPAETMKTPFGRFRQSLEDKGLPRKRGPVQAPNFCAAGNMSIGRDRFLALRGFDPKLSSAEDQDLALRHSSLGGQAVYLPEAAGIHRDDALDIRSYCQRVEWGARELIPFMRRHPDLEDNRLRLQVNGFVDWARDAPLLICSKLLKLALGRRQALEALFAVTGALERSAPRRAPLTLVYRLLLGIHMLRGIRAGLLQRPVAER